MDLNIMVILILLGGWLAGRIFKLIKLPAIMGMVLFGVAVSATLKDYYPQLLLDMAPFLKSMALIIILLRAGLGIQKSTLKKIGRTALFMSIIPCLMEAAILIVIAHFLFGYSWPVAGLTAFMLSAVSPAVIVPSMLNMKEQGIGKKKDVPTLILAGASVDDVIAITLFSLFLSMAIAPSTLLDPSIAIDPSLSVTQAISFFDTVGWQLMSIPISIAGGILGGIILGYLLVCFFKWRSKAINSTERTLILVTMALMLVKIGDQLHIAALLGIMTAGFVLLEKAEKIANETANKLSGIWVAAEITLFVLIGMAVDIPTAMKAGFKGLLLIGAGLTARSIGVVLSTAFSGLNWKERLFCVIAYWPKATVQAALGAVALDNGIAEGNEILSFAVLAIIITAPIGLLGINLSGKRLLGSD